MCLLSQLVRVHCLQGEHHPLQGRAARSSVPLETMKLFGPLLRIVSCPELPFPPSPPLGLPLSLSISRLSPSLFLPTSHSLSRSRLISSFCLFTPPPNLPPPAIPISLFVALLSVAFWMQTGGGVRKRYQGQSCERYGWGAPLGREGLMLDHCFYFTAKSLR